ncbi:VOC family protein [Capnocytophaga gingivalis]|uniref:VOC family protein n=1 Tax=Capnocytophaga gingivalis TaxID=1017 RepID=UPI0023F1373A|nr:VOC family protein [Capnocytophaga gingivalis]
MRQKFTLITLGVRDFKKALAFYENLGWQKSDKSMEAEVDAVLSKVSELGATIVKPAQKVFWGGYSGYFKDLDGYLFEVAYNPLGEFDENDNLKL